MPKTLTLKFINFSLRNIFMVPALLSALLLSSCSPIEEPIPPQSVKPSIDSKRIKKSAVYGDSTIYLQSRKEGIKTNDLIIKAKDGSLRYLCHNKFFISDFCISSKGVLYFCEAGMDYGYEVGTRGRDFRLKQIDLNIEPKKVELLLPDKTFTEPKRLELSADEKLLCFAGHFGEINIIDLSNKIKLDLDLGGIDPTKIHAMKLSDDKKSFIISIITGQTKTGAFIWEDRQFPLPTP